MGRPKRLVGQGFILAGPSEAVKSAFMNGLLRKMPFRVVFAPDTPPVAFPRQTQHIV
jgi:hypothetical protein